MHDPAPRRATYADVLATPENKVAELINGELFLSPRPALPHAEASTALVTAVRSRFGRGGNGPGQWIVLFEPELHFGDSVLVPDLAGWRRERMPSLDGDAAFLTVAPDWLCEVVSPATARIDRVRKLPLYAEAGVGHVWLVDPRAQLLEIYSLKNGHWVLESSHGGNEVVRAPPFADFELDLAILWADVQPTE